MILAVSRFRVANATEDQVAAAFRDRPRLVDAWPGFLGLETFTDAADPTIFYLVTRWTDAATFHAWHGSPAHRASHAWMPAGLRLDPTFTRLVELDRLPSRDQPDMFNLAVDRAAVIARFLEQSHVVSVLRLARDGTVLFANDVVAATLGVEAGHLSGSRIFARLTDHDAGLLRQVISGSASDRGRLLLNFLDAEGHPVTLACHLQVTPEDCILFGEPEYVSERRLQHLLLEANEELANLTRERHRATLAEEAARREAELANRTKDDGLAVVAHELRQPLNVARIALEVLRVRPTEFDRVRGTLERQLVQMTALVEDLLTASRVIRGTIALDRRRLDLRALTHETVEQLRAMALPKHQDVSLAVAPDPIDVEVDPARFNQVVGNILTNAIRYTPEGGTIRVSVARDGGMGVVRVRDSGEGMAPEQLERMFDLFVRGSANPGGLGIGLTVARRLIEMHGGRIGATSEGIGHGAEFLLHWPLAGALSSGEAAGQPSPPAGAAEESSTG